ncbi:MAG: type II secretion system protein GspN [Desulfobacteraceae bacterium 4484_190.2]|nr:MAG: type II secretion system protein GspN [Desulfobacteraceae bacterium 4484_190.2]
MIRSIFKHKKCLGYILYGILLMIVLLYYRFPSDALEDYLQSTADEINPRYHVLVGKVRPSLPFGMKFLKARVSLFMAESLLIRPGLWSFLKGESKYLFDCLAYGGDIKGSVHFSDNGGEASERPFTTSIELSDIRINDYEYLFTLIGRNVKGILGGIITYSGQGSLLINGTGEANLRISNGSVELLQPIFSLESVSFDDVRIKMILEKTKIKLTRVELKGREIKGTLSGTIGLKQNISNSRLALRGSIEPLEGFFKSENGAPRIMKLFKRRLRKGKLSFVVRGTPADPKIRFI